MRLLIEIASVAFMILSTARWLLKIVRLLRGCGYSIHHYFLLAFHFREKKTFTAYCCFWLEREKKTFKAFCGHEKKTYTLD